MGKHGAVTVAEVQTPDLHVSVGGPGGDERVVLVQQRHTRSGRVCVCVCAGGGFKMTSFESTLNPQADATAPVRQVGASIRT